VLRCLHGAGDAAQGQRRDENRDSVLFTASSEWSLVSTSFPIPLGVRFQKNGEGEVSCRPGAAPRIWSGSWAARFWMFLVGECFVSAKRPSLKKWNAWVWSGLHLERERSPICCVRPNVARKNLPRVHARTRPEIRYCTCGGRLARRRSAWCESFKTGSHRTQHRATSARRRSSNQEQDSGEPREHQLLRHQITNSARSRRVHSSVQSQPLAKSIQIVFQTIIEPTATSNTPRSTKPRAWWCLTHRSGFLAIPLSLVFLPPPGPQPWLGKMRDLSPVRQENRLLVAALRCQHS